MKKIVKLFSCFALFISCLFLGACDGGGDNTPKAVNAETQYERVLALVNEYINSEYTIEETQTLEYTSVKYVEITGDDNNQSIVGNVYYKFSFVIYGADGYSDEMGDINAYYSFEDDSIYSVGNKSWNKEYDEYYNRVKYNDSTDGVIGQIKN